jgi:hypothetical protein
MLEKLKFEAQAGGSQSEIHRIDLYDWSASDIGSDSPSVWAIEPRSTILSACMSTAPLLAHRITQSVLAVTGFG